MLYAAVIGFRNRLLQILARFAPGGQTLRVWLHRLRGVKIKGRVFIGTDALIETSYPHLVSIGDNVAIGIRSVIIAHFRGVPSEEAVRRRETVSVRIEDDAFIGPNVVIMPGVTIGRGAVVMAGSVVTRSIPELTVVQGNPAVPVARCGLPLGLKTSRNAFYLSMRPINAPSAQAVEQERG